MATPTTFSVAQHTTAIWLVTFDLPPINPITPELVRELHDLVIQLETDEQVKVAVFNSANDGFFLNHFDLARGAEFPVEESGLPTWTDMVVRLSKAPVISIADIRGRARGGGDEFALACDLRYASRERAIFGQPEVGTGILPGGGATERLPRLTGRDRALEAILSSDDYDAETAERYGWITRAIPDAELHDFVLALATRLAGFDKQALAAAKAQVNRAVLPPESELRAAYDAYFVSLGWPGFHARLPQLAQLGAAHGADVELRLGHYLGGR
jgi:enoyl-CoA hydratase/carnithine racemase